MAEKIVHSELPITNDGMRYRMTIVPLDIEGEDPLTLPYNPESYTIDTRPQWSERGTAGAWRDKADWVGNNARRLTYSHILTTQNVAEISSEGVVTVDTAALLEVERICTTLENWAERPTDRTQRPTRVDVLMGIKSFRGYIDHTKINRIRTTKDGYAITAEVQITFVANPD
ncbi:MAG: hypothetical protein ACF8MF_06805 [Phycisphaerales bacterium JB052]